MLDQQKLISPLYQKNIQKRRQQLLKQNKNQKSKLANFADKDLINSYLNIVRRNFRSWI